tara:strand:- start:50177 stop:50842 length:666 start_codon:yes stop_codon:yes gene_type:complete
MIKIILKNIMKLGLVILITGSSFSFLHAKESIKALTSKKKAQETKPEASAPEARIPNALKLHSVGVGVGQTFVHGDFDNYGEDKITADIIYTYSASHSFDFMANFHYSKHEFRQTYSLIRGLALGIKAKIFNFDSFSPYVVGGFGFYSPRIKRPVNGVVRESESKVVFGDHLGLGAELRLNRMFTTGVLIHYHNPFDVKQEVGSEVEGSYFKLLITVLYSF